jgi:hypothetical protein
MLSPLQVIYARQVEAMLHLFKSDKFNSGWAVMNVIQNDMGNLENYVEKLHWWKSKQQINMAA